MEAMNRDVNDHIHSSIIKLRYRTDSISKRIENVQCWPSFDWKKKKLFTDDIFGLLIKLKETKCLFILDNHKNEANKATISTKIKIKAKQKR